MSIEAMKQALEALNYLQGLVDTERGPKAAAALRQAIEQAEKQGSVAWQDTRKTWVDVPLKNVLKADYERGFVDGMQKQMQSSVDNAVNAMSKRKWVGLTDEEENAFVWNMPYEPGQAEIRAIEAKLREKNT